jgi:hypothetical protein
MDVQHIGQSKMTIDVSIERYSLKFWEHDGHSIFIVFTMMDAFLKRSFWMTSTFVDKLYQSFNCKSRVR